MPRTLEVYASQLDLRITPMLGGYRLREITPGLVQELLGREGVGDASIVKTATVLQSIFNRAVIEGLAERNPVALVRKPPQRRKREPDLVSPETVERIRSNLRESDAMLVSLLAYAGLRPESEAVTLTWGQVGKRSLRIDASKTGRQRQVRLLAPPQRISRRGERRSNLRPRARSCALAHRVGRGTTVPGRTG